MNMCRFSILICALVVARSAYATTYYVDNNGDDSHDGLSASTAWKTVAKANAAPLQPGDSVLFRRGATFHETIVGSKSGVAGKPITYGAYGAGAKPLFSAFSTISAWNPSANNIWRATVPNGGASLSSVVIAGAPQPLGRFPKPSAPKSGHLTFTSHSGQTSITDPTLAAHPDFTGGEIYIRTQHWTASRAKISSHVGTTLTFPDIGTALYDGFGYFIENHPATLTANGDWFYDPGTKTLGLYYVGTPPAARVPTIDRLVSLPGNKYLDFTDLAFEGANTDAIYGFSSSFINIRDCNVDLAGTTAIVLSYGSDIVVDGNTVTRSVSDGIKVYSGASLGQVTVTNNVITDTGTVVGMATPESQHQAISVTVGSGANIDRNTIKNTGYDAIVFAGNDISVKNNVIDTYCTVLDDGGAIYAWDGPLTPLSNRRIESNIITNAVGAPQGIPDGGTAAHGIYLDNNSNHVEVTDNTVYRIANSGFYGNSNEYVTLKRNNIFDTGTAWHEARLVNDGSSGANHGQDVTSMDVEDNVFFSKTPAQTSFQYVDLGIDFPASSTLRARLAAMGIVDHNYYYAPNPIPFGYYARDNKLASFVFPPNQSFAQWKITSSIEAASTLVPTYPSYVVGSFLSSNLYTDGDFESSIAGVSGSAMPLLSWDQTSKLSGKGSLSIAFTAPPATPNDYVSLKATFGPTSSSKRYLMRVSTRGTTEGGLLRIGVMQSAPANGALSPAQYRPFGTSRADHELLFVAPTSAAAASWQIDVFNSSGTSFIDDVSVYEVDATVSNPDDYVRIAVNPTDVATTEVLAGKYTDVRGNVYCGSTTLAPFSSVVLMKRSDPCGMDVDGGGTSDAALVPGGGGDSHDPGCNCAMGSRSPRGTPLPFTLCVLAWVIVWHRRRVTPA